MTIGDRVRRARKSAGLTQSQLGKVVGVRQATISELEKGESRSSAYLVQIAHACGVNPDWLATGRGDMHDTVPESPAPAASNVREGPSNIRHVPEISWVQAGCWTEVSEYSLDLADVPHWPCPVSCSERTFALRVEGDSMAPYFVPGTIIFVDPEVMPISGKKVVAMLSDSDSEKATFKQFIEDGDQKMLKAMNPNWPQPYIPINGNCRIVGTVIFAGMEM
ncbi:LexA family protein [Halomonas sp. FL8]